jgi:hypothetical protein
MDQTPLCVHGPLATSNFDIMHLASVSFLI